jgi:predicted  nucleic acid-binding Zn-ribbon protein
MRDRIECDVWICEHQDCNHFWLATSVAVPEKCPKCSRRKWHQTASTAELIRSKVAQPAVSDADLDERIEAIARRVFHEEWSSVPEEPEPVDVPDLSAAPLADKLAVARAALASVGTATPMPAVPAVELGPCPYTEYVSDIGETMACGLREHSWKIPHGQWKAI